MWGQKSWNQWKQKRRLQKLFEAEAPNNDGFLGRRLKVKDDKGQMIDVTVKTIVGSIPKPHFLEINGKHLVNALRFYAYMMGDTSITEDQFQRFEAIEWEAVKNSTHDKLTSELEKSGVIF